MPENHYETFVYLKKFLKDGFDFDHWASLQRTQLDFVQSVGFSPSSVFLDIGCGPLRLGSVLIPQIQSGWYYGLDINPKTLELSLIHI